MSEAGSIWLWGQILAGASSFKAPLMALAHFFSCDHFVGPHWPVRILFPPPLPENQMFPQSSRPSATTAAGRNSSNEGMLWQDCFLLIIGDSGVRRACGASLLQLPNHRGKQKEFSLLSSLRASSIRECWARGVSGHRPEDVDLQGAVSFQTLERTQDKDSTSSQNSDRNESSLPVWTGRRGANLGISLILRGRHHRVGCAFPTNAPTSQKPRKGKKMHLSETW